MTILRLLCLTAADSLDVLAKACMNFAELVRPESCRRKAVQQARSDAFKRASQEALQDFERLFGYAPDIRQAYGLDAVSAAEDILKGPRRFPGDQGPDGQAGVRR